MGNFVKERKFLRMLERWKYGFDYSDIINMKISFAEWLYSHLKHYEKWNIHDLAFHTIEYLGKKYTIGDAVEIIISITGDYLKLIETEENGGTYSFREEEAADDTLKFATGLWAEVMPYLWR